MTEASTTGTESIRRFPPSSSGGNRNERQARTLTRASRAPLLLAMHRHTLDRRPATPTPTRRGSTLPMRVHDPPAVDASPAFGDRRAPRDRARAISCEGEGGRSSVRRVRRRSSSRGWCCPIPTARPPAAWPVLWCLRDRGVWLARGVSNSAVERSCVRCVLSARFAGRLPAALGHHVTSNQPQLEPRSTSDQENSYAPCEDSCRMARSPPAALAS